MRTLALFLCFLGCYLLTASAHFYAADEETLFRVTESVVERHTFALPEDAWGMIGISPRPDGPRYAQYTPGQSLAAIPLYLLGKALAGLFPFDHQGYAVRFCVSLFGAFVTAATVALLYRFARALGYGGGASLGLAATYGLATTAWPHGRTFFAEPLTALCLLASFAALQRGTRSGRARRWLIASGTLAVAALVVKPQSLIALPVLGLYLLARARWSPALVVWRGGAGRVISLATWWGAGLALGALPFALFNAAIYGGPLRTGYENSLGDLFTTPFLTGLAGLTVSSGKGLLWYSPPALLALAGWWPFCRRHRAEALACLGMLLAHLAFYSRVSYWHGDGSWGPRYLAIAQPFIILPAVAALAGLRARRVRLALVALVVALGVLVQCLGVLVNFDWYILRSDEGQRHFSPPASPIVAHARTLGARLDEWRARAFPPPDTVFLRDGFSYWEGESAADPLFPRWTTGGATIAVHLARPDALLVKLTFFDHRPAALRTDRPAVLVNGAPVPAAAIERRDLTGTGEGWVYQFPIPASAGGNPTITLRSATWNPALVGTSDRYEDLGVFVHNVEVWREGAPLAVREALAIEPQPRTPRQRFWWYNNDAVRHHLVDWWVWYALVADFGQPRTALWIAGLLALALAPLALGLRLGWRTLPADLPPFRRRRRRRAWREPARAGAV